MNKLKPELQKLYKERFNDCKTAESNLLNLEIELSLLQQGIDTTKISKKDFDQFHRINVELRKIREKAEDKVEKLRQEERQEIMAIYADLETLNIKVRKEQGLPAQITKEELMESKEGSENEPESAESSQVAHPGAP